MSEINFTEVQEKIKKVQGILSKLDHVVTLYLHSSIYKNGDYTIELSPEEKNGLANEYLQIKAELETATGELPE